MAQSTYLFAWNPEKWPWDSLEQNIEELQNTGKTTLMWSCQSYKSIKIGDRAFLMKLGTHPKGIIASGYVVSEPFLAKHWSGEDRNVERVMIDFEIILHHAKEPILGLEIINTGNLSKQNWTPQRSGISIKPELVDELEGLWFDFLTTQNIIQNPFVEREKIVKTYAEGISTQIIQTRYERNPYARKKCLEYYGYKCSVCPMNFKEYYGEIGEEFIHVHHLTPLSIYEGKEYQINPIEDLRPVCPNCHAMLHKRKIPYSIEELKEIINRNL